MNRFGSIAIVVCAFSTLCSAQQPISLESALATARKNHPLLQAAGSRIGVAAGALTQARLRPNPLSFFQSENWRGWGTPGLHVPTGVDSFALITQPFETAGKRARRMEFAEAGIHRTELERELSERHVIAQVKHAYWAAVAAARIHEVLLQNMQNFRQIVEYHEIRVREGALPEADLLKVQLESERISFAANTAALERERARIELFRTMGQIEFPEVRFTDSLDPPLQPPGSDVAQALATRVEMRIAQQLREEATRSVRLQQSLTTPNVEAIFGYKRTGGLNTMVGGMQMNLPFFNRNQGNVASAEASVRVADAEIAATAAIVRAEVESARRDVMARQSQLSGTLQKLMSQATESSRIAQAAYREGGADLLRLLDAERVRIELEALYYRALGEYRQSLATLETAMGVN